MIPDERFESGACMQFADSLLLEAYHQDNIVYAQL